MVSWLSLSPRKSLEPAKPKSGVLERVATIEKLPPGAVEVAKADMSTSQDKARLAAIARAEESKKALEAKKQADEKKEAAAKAEAETSKKKAEEAKKTAELKEIEDAKAAADAEAKAKAEAAELAAQADDEAKVAAAEAEKERKSKAEADAIQAAERAAEERAVEQAKAAEEASKAADNAARAADDEKLLKMKSMTSEELVAMHLEEKLGADRAQGMTDLENTEKNLKKNEDSSAALAARLAETTAEKNAVIADQDEKLTSTEKLIAINESLRDQCTTLGREIDTSAFIAAEGINDKKTVFGRVDGELDEARGRLDEQTKHCNELQTELLLFNTMTAPTIAKYGVELMKLNSDVTAKTEAHEKWVSSVGALNSELDDLQMLTDDSAAIEAKSERLSATKAQIHELQSRIEKDESDLAIRVAEEKEMDERNHVAEAEAANLRRQLMADVETVTLLSEIEEKTLVQELSSGPGHSPTDAELTERTRALLEERKSGVLEAKAYLLQEVLKHDETAANDRDDRAKEKKLVKSERIAIEVAHEQRKRFLADKQHQLDVEQKEVDKARCELLDRQHVMEMLKKEIAEGEAGLAARDKLLKAAVKAKQDKQSALNKLNLQSKLKAAAMQAKLASERAVQMQQHAYVNAIVQKQAIERELTTKAEALAKSDGAGAAKFGSAPVGLRGKFVVDSNNTSQSQWIKELKGLRDEAATAKETAVKELAAAVKAAARDESLLKEQHTAIAHTKAKLNDYIDNLYLNLPSNPASPRASMPSSTPGRGTPLTGSKKQLGFDDGAGIASPLGLAIEPLRGDSPDPTSPRQMAALPSKEVQSTPYAAAHKYLAAYESREITDLQPAKDASAAELERISQQILSEQNHPLFNPDLKVSSPASQQGGWFRRQSSTKE